MRNGKLASAAEVQRAQRPRKVQLQPSVLGLALSPSENLSLTLKSHSVAQAGVQWLTACNLCLLGSSSWDYRLIFVFLVEMGFYHVGQAGLELLTSGGLPALASQNRESPGREATWVASATLLAGAALLPAPSVALPSAEYTGRTGSAGPIPTRKTAIGSAED
ncbi:UPF0764 protein C16orf89 [Plecturocebus cupreus]